MKLFSFLSRKDAPSQDAPPAPIEDNSAASGPLNNPELQMRCREADKAIKKILDRYELVILVVPFPQPDGSVVNKMQFRPLPKPRIIKADNAGTKFYNKIRGL